MSSLPRQHRVARLLVATAAIAGLGAGLASAAHATPAAHGRLLQVAPPGPSAGLSLNANQSNNWFGYNQGQLEQGGKAFHSIAGNWTVPSASQHTSGQSEASSDWIGIGGGCVDADCVVTDNTLIQTGTEQDVNRSGKPSYGAWWEVIPGPSIAIPKLTIHPGDRMHAQIAEAPSGSEVWNITLRDITTGKTFTKTVPYSSSHATAEWIEETPLVIGTDAGLAPLPDLSNTAFDLARTNGAKARLKSSERMVLVDSNSHVIGTPSAPDADQDGFGLCTWATSCPVPAS